MREMMFHPKSLNARLKPEAPQQLIGRNWRLGCPGSQEYRPSVDSGEFKS